LYDARARSVFYDEYATKGFYVYHWDEAGAHDESSRYTRSSRNTVITGGLMTEDQRPDTNDSTDARYETLKLEYEQICSSHQAITDFRGKLLGLLPLATGAGIFLLLDKSIAAKNQTQVAVFLAAAGVFGAAVTVGLYCYEHRGMAECHLLRSRGAQLEHALHHRDDCSRFQSNPSGFVGPLGAGPIVYFAVIGGWIFVALYGFWRSSPGWQEATGLLIIALYFIAVIYSFRYSKKKGHLVRGNKVS
jgi:hypothetical protein